jgi:type I protein arginine methyltransferase
MDNINEPVSSAAPVVSALEKDAVKRRLREPDVKVRMTKDSYVKFEGSDMVVIQNAFSESAMRIKSDILLILFEMGDWKLLVDVLTPWPPGDQEKIMDYMEQFHGAQLLEIDGYEQQVRANDDAHQKEKLSHNKVPINVENHHNMLKDNVRLSAYRRAIEQVVQPDSVVMDMGAGTGILSFFASQAGANKVYAIERRPHIVDLAKALAEANQLDNIQFIEAVTTQVKPEELTPRPDVLVSEIIGDGILEENILEYTMDVRDRLLLPGATLIPCRLEIWGFAFYSEYNNAQVVWEANEFNDLYNLDFSLLGRVLSSKATLRRERFHTQLQKAMSAPVKLHDIDLRTIQKADFAHTCELALEKAGQLSGVCLYFKAWLTESTCLTNSPWAPATHWTQLLYTLAEPVDCNAGQSFAFDLIYDGSLRVTVPGLNA